MSLADRFADYGACDVSDALLKLKVPNAGLLPDIVMFSPERQAGSTKIVGEAYTVKMVSKEEVDAPRLNITGHYIDTVPANSVLFISAPRHQVNAAFGGIMGARAQYLGAVGAVIDGRIRDVSEHRSLGFPVFSRGTSTIGTGDQCKPSELNVPVCLKASGSNGKDVWINPGDVIIADLDGVVCCPKEKVEEVLELMPKLTIADDNVMGDVKNGVSIAEAFKTHRGKL
ncbi:hypothetical protein YB2330_001560 [Saitoella coloradoensis]